MLIHLTKQADTFTTILREGQVRALTPYGAAYNVGTLAPSQKVASFSEMAALASVADLARRHGQFGLGFLKPWMQARGAAPVWYLPRDSEVQVEIFNTVRDAAFRNAPDPEHMLWRITPFIDYPRDVGAEGAAVPYDWRWEREWRVRGDLTFQNDDVAILFVPGAQHEWVTEWWKQEMIEGWGGYMPPTVDPNWPRERQEDVIRQGPTVLEVEMPVPVEPWEDEIDTAPHVGDSSAEDDEGQQLQAEIREELNGWLDEMARDDL